MPTSTSSHRTVPPPVPDELARAHARYWRFNLALIAVLMTIGFAVSFLVPFFAPALAALRFAGFSLPFYLGAQGAILVYLLLIAVYVVLMQRADRTLRRAYATYAAHASSAAGRGGVPDEVSGSGPTGGGR
jgi:putative solute:sodium symporter small subunit